MAGILDKLERPIGPDGNCYECMLQRGKLLCCEKCPGTYHLKCLGVRGDCLCATCRDNDDSSKKNLLKIWFPKNCIVEGREICFRFSSFKGKIEI